MKILGYVFGVIATLVIAIIVFSGSIIKGAVEGFGSDIVGAPVQLDGVDLNFLSGEGQLTMFKVSNHEGFTNPYALEIDKVFFKVDPMSLFGNKVVIRDVKILAPAVTYETGLGGSNFDKIQRHVNAYLADNSVEKKDSTNGEVVAAEKGSKAGTKVQLDYFLVNEAKLLAHISTPAGDKSFDAVLPKLEIRNIGREEGGADIVDVVNRIVKPFTQSVIGTASNKLVDVDAFKQRANDRLNKEADKLKDKFKSLF